MKNENLARLIVLLFIIIAVAIPFSGRWLNSRSQESVIELHANMPENGGWSVETIHAQAGQPIRLHITSDDVVHGFAIGKSEVPALEIKPGEYTVTVLKFDLPGKYIFYCNRWCGPNHWRMRGTIEIEGDKDPIPAAPKPLFLQLGIDLDSPEVAEVVPTNKAAAELGAKLKDILPVYASESDTYLTNSPAKLWLRFRADPALSKISDNDLWNAVAWTWQQQTSPQALKIGFDLYSTTCAACHSETGQGNGVMVRDLPTWDPSIHKTNETPHQLTGEGLFSPPDFTDPKILLGVSPALLEGKIIRGGMGTGMPYWGSIFTTDQIKALVSYLYGFAWGDIGGEE
ncbi:MAG: hypothetical protein CVU46_17950 [Chloroflexi bacterium HGW-Chloroflexi-8]|nr:MAG: hypothetical protein CVU46_17950 [Chloroflexi bacterium HGW-Chloroflexi-8]